MAIPVTRRELMTTCLLALVVAFAAASGVDAQARFKVVTRNTVADLSGLTIYTIRDEQQSSCYLLFALEQSGAPAPTPSRPDQLPTAQEERRAPERRAQDPEKWATSPWRTQTPGEMTGGWEHLAESMRLALVDPSTAEALAAPLETKLTDVSERLGRIELLLKNLGTAQRLAVLPVSCAPAEPK